MNGTSLRDPIVLVHALGFDRFSLAGTVIEYFRGIPRPCGQPGTSCPNRPPSIRPGASWSGRPTSRRSSRRTPMWPAERST